MRGAGIRIWSIEIANFHRFIADICTKFICPALIIYLSYYIIFPGELESRVGFI